MDSPSTHAEDKQLIAERRRKLAGSRAKAGVTYPNDFKLAHRALPRTQRHGDIDKRGLAPHAVGVSVAGRMVLKCVIRNVIRFPTLRREA
jgi:lysyl-tRNA synthetase class 2